MRFVSTALFPIASPLGRRYDVPMMTWKPLSLIAAILFMHLLVFGTLGESEFAPTPTPRPVPQATYTPNPALARHYVSPTVSPTPTASPAPTSTPGPTRVFRPGPTEF